jgi:type I restriction enzyme R subunit
MMTTGYDCQDLLNICLMRPIFSPGDFIQIKGRGTRKYNFTSDIIDSKMKAELGEQQKQRYKIFDFFANCEYFEEKFNYDESLSLPKTGGEFLSIHDKPLRPGYSKGYNSAREDHLSSLNQTEIGPEGMKIDRMYFDRFEQTILNAHPANELREQALAGKWVEILAYIERNVLNRPEDYFTLEKLRASINIDRRITMREILEKILGLIPCFKTRDELLDDEFDKFDSRHLPEEQYVPHAKAFFKAYIEDAEFRVIIDQGNFTLLNVSPHGDAFRRLSPELRALIPEYIKDNVPLNNFVI